MSCREVNVGYYAQPSLPNRTSYNLLPTLWPDPFGYLSLIPENLASLRLIHLALILNAKGQYANILLATDLLTTSGSGPIIYDVLLPYIQLMFGNFWSAGQLPTLGSYQNFAMSTTPPGGGHLAGLMGAIIYESTQNASQDVQQVMSTLLSAIQQTPATYPGVSLWNTPAKQLFDFVVSAYWNPADNNLPLTSTATSLNRGGYTYDSPNAGFLQQLWKNPALWQIVECLLSSMLSSTIKAAAPVFANDDAVYFTYIQNTITKYGVSNEENAPIVVVLSMVESPTTVNPKSYPIYQQPMCTCPGSIGGTTAAPPGQCTGSGSASGSGGGGGSRRLLYVGAVLVGVLAAAAFSK
jgi:hypothetical protein